MDLGKIAFWLFVATSLARAQESTVFELGPGISPPVVVAKQAPAYSAEARLAKLEGGVLLSMVVGSDSRPRDIRVVRTLGLGLDEQAIESVRAWQFKPGTRNEMPVDVRVNEEVFFRPSRNLWDWHLARAVFETPPRAQRPTLIKVKFPPTVDVEENASVTIAFTVLPSGAPAHLRIANSSDARWNSKLLAAVRKGWRFRPGTRNGKRVATPAWFEFVRGSHAPLPFPPVPE